MMHVSYRAASIWRREREYTDDALFIKFYIAASVFLVIFWFCTSWIPRLPPAYEGSKWWTSKNYDDILVLAADAKTRLKIDGEICYTFEELKHCVVDGKLTTQVLVGGEEINLYVYAPGELRNQYHSNENLTVEAEAFIREKAQEGAYQFAKMLRGMGAMTPIELKYHQSDLIQKIGR